ncbi:hypothetical protein HS088_TW22G00207 [Tripterygium wilfordii]|uniref:RRP15-like protein n=1 Tax=Tripterygium wilfordii TaxID=458696 RepID=A0A7J7BXB0_TRIWF|nr:RRP15-like protein [Tripterygium wilfordii]KAF5726529.1 hypothetical protein HS088_TW22G00207 [Tripterygium wilfordii]
MAEETRVEKAAVVRKTRRERGMKGFKSNKKQKRDMAAPRRSFKVDKRMEKMFKKRARDYNSDSDDDGEKRNRYGSAATVGEKNNAGAASVNDDDSDVDMAKEFEGSGDEEDGEIMPGIIKLAEGCRAFKMAFKSILKKSVSDDSLGPVLSAHKKLVVEKLAQEEAEKKVKGEARKQRQMVGEKGHVKPANYLDAHDKFLIGVATKGVVKLFNAVNKAQSAQKGLDPSRSKDAKVIKKRRKEAFFSELGKKSLPVGAKVDTFSGPKDSEGPSWAPLRDNYLLTNPKLKDWDKMQETNEADAVGGMSEDSGSDED